MMVLTAERALACSPANIGTQTMGGRGDIAAMSRGGQYKYPPAAIRNTLQVITLPAMARQQVLLSVMFRFGLE